MDIGGLLPGRELVPPTNSVVSSTTPNGIIVTSDGKATWIMTKWMISVGSTVNANFDPNGDYQGPIGLRATIGGRSTLATILENIATNGVVQASGIDFDIAYVNKDTDHIADGFGSPLAGGKAANTALLVSPPTPEAHKWVNGFSAGVFTKTQPAFSDVSGTAAAGQIPALSALSGQITGAQLPSGVISATIVTAKLTGGGTNGSMTFTNGLLTAETPAT
jgi:hypothetical protein